MNGEERGNERSRLTDEEVKELRRIIESEKRMRWLWASLRNLAVWIVAIITAVTVGYGAIGDFIKHFSGK